MNKRILKGNQVPGAPDKPFFFLKGSAHIWGDWDNPGKEQWKEFEKILT